jgi:hypothetical protein
MHKLNSHGSFANGRSDTLHALSPDIADREDSGKARFERIGRPAQRPSVLKVRTGLDETLGVEREATS